MKIAVFTLKTNGKIHKVHEFRKITDVDDEQQTVRRYNSNSEHKDTVEIVELNQLETFLYNRSELNIKEYKEDIENMSCTMNELEKSLDWLCNRVKDTEQ